MNMEDKIVKLKVNVGKWKVKADGKTYHYHLILIPTNKIRILNKKATIAIYPAEWIDKSD